MSRSNDDRLPYGMQRVGYDADTQQYTYQDADGSYWEGLPGNTYGELRRVGASSQSRSSHTRQPSSPATAGRGHDYGHDVENFLSAVGAYSKPRSPNTEQPPSPAKAERDHDSDGDASSDKNKKQGWWSLNPVTFLRRAIAQRRASRVESTQANIQSGLGSRGGPMRRSTI